MSTVRTTVVGSGHLSTLGSPEPTSCKGVFYCGVVHTRGWMSKGYPLCPNVSGGATATGAVVGYNLWFPHWFAIEEGCELWGIFLSCWPFWNIGRTISCHISTFFTTIRLKLQGLRPNERFSIYVLLVSTVQTFFTCTSLIPKNFFKYCEWQPLQVIFTVMERWNCGKRHGTNYWTSSPGSGGTFT